MTSAGPAEAPDPVVPDGPRAPGVHHVRFTGSAREYFRIWLVNTLLIVATLGGYAPWAKVRKRRWLYGHAWVAGANFDYHASPSAILRGRLLALAALAAYSGLGLLAPSVAIAVLLAVLVLAPWFVLRAQAFAAANTSYRHVRLAFHGRYRDALRAIGPLAAWPLLVFVMPDEDAEVSAQMVLLVLAPFGLLALLHPYMVAWRWRLRMNGLSWGSARFACAVPTRRFYGVYVRACLLALLVLIVLGTVAVFAGDLGLPRVLRVPLSVAALGALLTLPSAYVRSRVTNLALGATRIGPGAGLTSTLSCERLARLYLENTVGVLCSLGLLVPWAVVRTARYRAESLTLQAGDLDDVLARSSVDVGAAGEEVAELFDFDFGL